MVNVKALSLAQLKETITERAGRNFTWPFLTRSICETMSHKFDISHKKAAYNGGSEPFVKGLRHLSKLLIKRFLAAGGNRTFIIV